MTCLMNMRFDMKNETKKLLIKVLKLYQAKHGYAPSYRELGHLMCCSHEKARYLLQQLEEAGVVTITPGVSRAIRLNGV